MNKFLLPGTYALYLNNIYFLNLRLLLSKRNFLITIALYICPTAFEAFYFLLINKKCDKYNTKVFVI